MTGRENNKIEKKGFFGRVFGERANREQENELAGDHIKDGETKGGDVDGDLQQMAANPIAYVEPKQAELEKSEPENIAPQSWLSKLKSGLTKSSNKLSENITDIFTKARLDDDRLQQLEDILIQSDLGIDMSVRITQKLAESRYNKDISAEDVGRVLASEIETVLAPVAKPLIIDGRSRPHIILMIGVNGAGKTTTIGKLASRFSKEGKTLTLVAGDTFRAAAVEQLKIWGERTSSPVVARAIGADASGLVYDAIQQAAKENSDIVMIDTAGRLQNKSDLMAELEKIIRVIKKHDPTAPHDVILVLDATTGQNALNQVDVFHQTAGVTGLIMTKLDGTARGGILVAIADKYKLPIHAVGVGEAIDDMQGFDPKEFAQAIANI